MALTVTAGDLEALRFCESDEARSIVQNIAVILTTAKGTAPGDREFGVDMSFLDLPLPVAFQSTSPMRGRQEKRTSLVGTFVQSREDSQVLSCFRGIIQDISSENNSAAGEF